MPTPKRGPCFCPSPTLPDSLPGLTHTHASWNRPETPKAISGAPDLASPPPTPFVTSLTSRCAACPPVPKPLFICWGWPHCPRVLGPDAWAPSSFLLTFAPRAKLPDCVPLPPRGPDSGLHPLPSGSSASSQASRAVPATRPTRALLEPGTDQLRPRGPHPLSWTRSSPQCPHGGLVAWAWWGPTLV